MIDRLKIYNQKKVLVTGHTGFKGSWLCIWLKKLGAEVVGYALDPYTERDNFSVTGLSNKVVDIRGDIRDPSKLRDTFAKYNPEIVFHLAAQTLVRESYHNPKETFDVNIGGTVNVLENCRLSDSAKIAIVISSDKCYEDKGWIWGYRENDRLGGYEPYSASKACAELVIRSYRNVYFNPNDFPHHKKAVASVRAGNVIGGGDWQKDRIIPDCIRSLEKEKPIQVRNPLATRPWQFVLEPLGGYLLLGSRMLEDPQQYCEAWNFGPDYSAIITVEELVELLLEKYGEGSWEFVQEQSEKKETKYLSIDTCKAKAKLGWRPTLSIAQAIEQTIDWYKSYKVNLKMFDFCDNQISAYMELWMSNEDH